MPKPSRWILALALLSAAFSFGAGRALSQPLTTNELLLPYFEVDLLGLDVTTLLAVANADEEAVDVRITVHTNWGIPILSVPFTLDHHEVKTINLRDWFVHGQIPGRSITPDELLDLQLCLSGQRSLADGHFFSTSVAPNLAVGYLRIRSVGAPLKKVLWGDYFTVDPERSFALGEALVNLEESVAAVSKCRRHLVRFLQGGTFDAGTELLLWTSKQGQPSEQPEFPAALKLRSRVACFDEPGDFLEQHTMTTLPVEAIKVGDMNVPEPFGWLDIDSNEESVLVVRYQASSIYGVMLRTWCKPEEAGGPDGTNPSVAIEKETNGFAVDEPPGPSIPLGQPVEWSYSVTNTGDEPLTEVTVSDDRGVAVSCPASELVPGETMVCTASGSATECQYQNVGRVVASPAGGGSPVRDSDPSYYYGTFVAALDLEKLTNGEDADDPPGPTIPVGTVVTWSYVVTNSGEVELSNVTVADDRDLEVTCPATTLAPGATMTCTAHGYALTGQYRNVGSATGEPPCGQAVTASDPSHYFGRPTQPGDQGCTPGYWKNHLDSWPPTGYSPNQTVVSVFSAAAAFPELANASLQSALAFGGGPGVEGAAEILLRAAVAALLNSAHPGVNYPLTTTEVVAGVNGALASNNRDTMLALAAELDAQNNLGCPLN